MIDGVIIAPLKQILDERGKVMHMLKATDPVFKSFGEIYFSCIYPNVVKAWHIHHEMTLNYAVPTVASNLYSLMTAWTVQRVAKFKKFI